MKPLTELEWFALLRCKAGRWMPAAKIPHGVYRALMIKGYLRSANRGYRLTAEGRAAIKRSRDHE
jgi:hypothetical protein